MYLFRICTSGELKHSSSMMLLIAGSGIVQISDWAVTLKDLRKFCNKHAHTEEKNPACPPHPCIFLYSSEEEHDCRLTVLQLPHHFCIFRYLRSLQRLDSVTFRCTPACSRDTFDISPCNLDCFSFCL